MDLPEAEMLFGQPRIHRVLYCISAGQPGPSPEDNVAAHTAFLELILTSVPEYMTHRRLE